MREEIILSLAKSGSSENLERLADHLVKNKISLLSLIDILDQPKPVSMRFIWMVGGLCMRQPEIVLPCVEQFYLKRHHVNFANYDRSLAKMFFLAGMPSHLEGEIINELFRWLTDPKISVSTKHYSLLALNKIALKYPDLKKELKIVLEDQMDKNSPAWRKQAMNVLKKL